MSKLSGTIRRFTGVDFLDQPGQTLRCVVDKQTSSLGRVVMRQWKLDRVVIPKHRFSHLVSGSRGICIAKYLCGCDGLRATSTRLDFQSRMPAARYRLASWT
jgi:hypothetical protein